jgi:hypothetical protein
VASVVALMALSCAIDVTKRASAAAPPVSETDAKKAAEAPPFGIVHDFGKVQRGTQAEHAFRIVNTSGVPLEITSVKRGGGCAGAAVSARVSRRLLQPGEEAQLNVSLDTRRFKGRRTCRVLVETDNGKPTVTTFYVTADAQD